jgi:hypothetical protein
MDNSINKYQADVLVIGGSLEGCIAALEWAKKGKKVILVENSGSLGGAATNGLYIHFPLKELMADKELGEYGQLLMNREDYPCTKNGVLIYDQSLKVVLQRLLNQAGVQTLTHIYPAEARTHGEKIDTFRLGCKTGYLDVDADIYIDATDKMDGAGAALLKAAPLQSRVQIGIRCNRVSGQAIKTAVVNAEAGDGYLVGEMDLPLVKEVDKLKLSAKSLKVFHNEDCREVILYGIEAQLSEINIFTLSKAHGELRIFAYELRDLLKKEWEGFAQMNIIQTAPKMDCYGLRTYADNPFNNLILLNNKVADYSNIQAVKIGIKS